MYTRARYLVTLISSLAVAPVWWEVPQQTFFNSESRFVAQRRGIPPHTTSTPSSLHSNKNGCIFAVSSTGSMEQFVSIFGLL